MKKRIPAIVCGALPVARSPPAFIGKNRQGKLFTPLTHRKISA
jgi:hypothetical protein